MAMTDEDDHITIMARGSTNCPNPIIYSFGRLKELAAEIRPKTWRNRVNKLSFGLLIKAMGYVNLMILCILVIRNYSCLK